MRVLYVHAGHGKTGSSYLQTCFALSRARLRARGVVYRRGRAMKDAAAGRATAGNGHALVAAIRHPALAPFVALWLLAAPGHALISAEKLFFVLANPRHRGRLARLARLAGFDRVELLLFIRDPADHLVSVHQQGVKREGETRDLDALAAEYVYPRVAKRFLEAAAGCGVTVLNYSRLKQPINEIAEDWLGAPRGALLTPASERVNRSLTAAETVLMRDLNARHGKAAALVSDRLCERLPDIPPDRAAPSAAALAGLLRRMRRAMRRVNAQLPPDQRYRLKPPPPAPPRAAATALSPEQRRVIEAALREAGLPEAF